MTNQIRTPEEIEQLKIGWAKDPIWDIEDTEGFEAHHDELKAWREDREREIEKRVAEQLQKRMEYVMNVTGVGMANKDILASLLTWGEVETESRNIERVTDDPNVAIAAMLIRATLLQAAQLKRIADTLEELADQDDGTSLINSAKIWGSEQ